MGAGGQERKGGRRANECLRHGGLRSGSGGKEARQGCRARGRTGSAQGAIVFLAGHEIAADRSDRSGRKVDATLQVLDTSAGYFVTTAPMVPMRSVALWRMALLPALSKTAPLP